MPTRCSSTSRNAEGVARDGHPLSVEEGSMDKYEARIIAMVMLYVVIFGGLMLFGF
jgi:hypothetical protein